MAIVLIKFKVFDKKFINSSLKPKKKKKTYRIGLLKSLNVGRTS